MVFFFFKISQWRHLRVFCECLCLCIEYDLWTSLGVGSCPCTMTFWCSIVLRCSYIFACFNSSTLFPEPSFLSSIWSVLLVRISTEFFDMLRFSKISIFYVCFPHFHACVCVCCICLCIYMFALCASEHAHVWACGNHPQLLWPFSLRHRLTQTQLSPAWVWLGSCSEDPLSAFLSGWNSRWPTMPT